jgi:hypothetical protein
MPVERLVASGWKRGLQAPSRRREKNSPGRLAERRLEDGGGAADAES